jgi:hypothetical protein
MKQYTVSYGKVVLSIQEAEEAFENVRDASAALAASRRKLIKKLAGVKA